MENPTEHGFTRTQVVKVLGGHYRRAYEKTFGPLPTAKQLARLPTKAAPAGTCEPRGGVDRHGGR